MREKRLKEVLKNQTIVDNILIIIIIFAMVLVLFLKSLNYDHNYK